MDWGLSFFRVAMFAIGVAIVVPALFGPQEWYVFVGFGILYGSLVSPSPS